MSLVCGTQMNQRELVRKQWKGKEIKEWWHEVESTSQIDINLQGTHTNSNNKTSGLPGPGGGGGAEDGWRCDCCAGWLGLPAAAGGGSWDVLGGAGDDRCIGGGGSCGNFLICPDGVCICNTKKEFWISQSGWVQMYLRTSISMRIKWMICPGVWTGLVRGKDNFIFGLECSL